MFQEVNVNDSTYNIEYSLNSSYQVLLSGRVTDELTHGGPVGILTVSSSLKNVLIKVMEGGFFCLAGEVRRVFPQLDTTAYKVDLHISVPGYRGVSLPLIDISQKSNFPLEPPLAVALKRLPIRIQGRVVGLKADEVVPIIGAHIRLIDEPNPLQSPTEYVLALRTPLHVKHDKGTTVRQHQLLPVGSPKQLTDSAPMGSQTLTFGGRPRIAVNDVLHVGPETVGEYVVVASVLKETGQVVLYGSLNHSFAAGTNVQKLKHGSVGTSTELARSAEAGEGVLFLNEQLQGEGESLPKELHVDTIEIFDATLALVEYHAIGTLTDEQGYYRLDGVNGVREVYMDLDTNTEDFPVASTPQPGDATAWTVDYGQPINNVNFRLLP